jgi:hypothetical protein
MNVEPFFAFKESEAGAAWHSTLEQVPDDFHAIDGGYRGIRDVNWYMSV